MKKIACRRFMEPFAGALAPRLWAFLSAFPQGHLRRERPQGE